jgi:hypothetical protein
MLVKQTKTDTVSARRLSRAPAWMYFVAGTFIAYYVVMIYSELYEPRRIGIDCEFKDGGLAITRVVQNSPAARAGIKPGDRLLAIDESAIHSWEDWRRFVATLEIGRNYDFRLERAGQNSGLRVRLGRQPGDPFARLERKRYVQFFVLLLAFALAFRRPHERAAQIAALFLAAVGTAPLFPGTEMTAVWRNLPVPLGATLWIPQITHLVLLPLFFTSFAVFPRQLFQGFWPWILVWSPAVVVAAWWFPHVYEHIYHPPILVDLPAWLRFVVGLSVLVYGGGGLAALALNYFCLPEPRDRQRMRVLLAGTLIGWLPGLLFLAAIFWGTLTESALVWFFVSTEYRLFALGCFLAFPLSLAYALVRHRVLDISANPGSGDSLSLEKNPDC